MAVGTLCYRKEVLSLYRRIFRIARQWHAITTGDAAEESRYIREEARKLFRRYKHVSLILELCLREGPWESTFAQLILLICSFSLKKSLGDFHFVAF